MGFQRVIRKCPVGQGSGSPSPTTRALAPSQSYRFGKNSGGPRQQILQANFLYLRIDREGQGSPTLLQEGQGSCGRDQLASRTGVSRVHREATIPCSILASSQTVDRAAPKI